MIRPIATSVTYAQYNFNNYANIIGSNFCIIYYLKFPVSLTVEQLPSKQKVIGSNPVLGKGAWQSGYCSGL